VLGYQKSFWKLSGCVNYQINYTYSIQHNTGLLKNVLCLCMYASCFEPFSVHLQECQYKNLMNKNVQKLLVAGEAHAKLS